MPGTIPYVDFLSIGTNDLVQGLEAVLEARAHAGRIPQDRSKPTSALSSRSACSQSPAARSGSGGIRARSGQRASASPSAIPARTPWASALPLTVTLWIAGILQMTTNLVFSWIETPLLGEIVLGEWLRKEYFGYDTLSNPCNRSATIRKRKR